ncbi:hypothetical protein [Bradyrhizobium sp. STM 3566]|uniref:hypothetical protein n=1 Tax=Bradyrhizobium sp. STM 3566 TaxID=578928 RepID=UPI00388E268F
MAELIEPLFEFALFRKEPRSEDLIDLSVKRPQLIDGHRVKVFSIHASQLHSDRTSLGHQGTCARNALPQKLARVSWHFIRFNVFNIKLG